MKNRREIDGLRAVAVLPVILFHAGFDVFSGGYVGVDVFFVISGYLITTILIADIERGDFSLWRFYERRARRILPALFFVMLCCLPFAWAWLYGSRMQDFAQSLVAVSLFASNILFWRESGYFATAAEEKPLLHTWSLAVEEQYYLLFPILLFVLWRFGRDRVFWSIVVLSAISLALADWGSRNWPSANFYLAPTRAWELFAGSIAAFIVRTRGIRKNELMSLLGLGAIVFAIFAYDKYTPFPGVFALVPVMGVFLVVLFADERTLAAKILSNRVFVGVGLISYSAYLWHQPLFAFARIKSIGEPGMPLMAGLAVLSLLLAAFSWKYVEQPFRQSRNTIVKRRSTIFAGSLAGLGAFVLIGVAGHVTNGFDQRLSQRQKEFLAWENYQRSTPYREGNCFLGPEDSQTSFKDYCDGGGNMIWGDSHAAALASGWIQQDTSLSQFTKSSCPPILGQDFEGRLHCKDVNEFVLGVIERKPPNTVYLHANWIEAGNILHDLRTTISLVKAAGVPNVVVLGSVPSFPPTLPERLLPLGDDVGPGTRLHVNVDALSSVDDRLRDIAAESGASFISVLGRLCEGNFCDAVITDGNGSIAPLAWDNVHLTVSGAEYTLRKTGLIGSKN